MMVFDFLKYSELISSNLHNFRIIKQFTLKEVAAKANISLSYLSQIESGKRSISSEIVRKILYIYEIKLTTFASHIVKTYLEQRSSYYNKITDYKILISGKININEYSLLLTTPRISEIQSQILEYNIPIDYQTEDEFHNLDLELEIYVVQGKLLIYINNTEKIIEEGYAYGINGKSNYSFRNIGNKQIKLLVRHPKALI